MTPLEKFIAESQAVCDAVHGYCNKCGYAGACTETRIGLSHDGCNYMAMKLPKSRSQVVLAQALQHLRDVMRSKAELKDLLDRQMHQFSQCRDDNAALSGRVAELEQRLPEFQNYHDVEQFYQDEQEKKS